MVADVRPNKIVGKCWACQGPVRTYTSAWIVDRTTGTKRLAHQGLCEDRVRSLVDPKIFGYREGV